MLDKAITDALIQAVAVSSNEIIMPRFRNLSGGAISSKTSPNDLVTEADRMAEARITANVMSLMPHARVVGEEAVSEDPSLMGRLQSSGTCVIVDPIDGTWNYAHGAALFATLLAVVENGETVFGLIYDCATGDYIAARKGEGAWFISGARKRLLGKGSLALWPRVAPGRDWGLSDLRGFVPTRAFSRDIQPAVFAAEMDLGMTQNQRCSGHDYFRIATGEAEFQFAHMVKPWDHAAGAMIVEEAGGFSGFLDDGSRYTPRRTEGMMITAPNRAVFERLRTHFAPALGLSLEADRPQPSTDSGARETIEVEIDAETLAEAQTLGLDVDAIVDARLEREIAAARKD